MQKFVKMPKLYLFIHMITIPERQSVYYLHRRLLYIT